MEGGPGDSQGDGGQRWRIGKRARSSPSDAIVFCRARMCLWLGRTRSAIRSLATTTAAQFPFLLTWRFERSNLRYMCTVYGIGCSFCGRATLESTRTVVLVWFASRLPASRVSNRPCSASSHPSRLRVAPTTIPSVGVP